MSPMLSKRNWTLKGHSLRQGTWAPEGHLGIWEFKTRGHLSTQALALGHLKGTWTLRHYGTQVLRHSGTRALGHSRHFI